MSSSFGSDFITILWEDKLKENCFDRSKPWNFGDPTHCNVYIGVLGYSHSVYTIMITGNTNLPTRVQYNIPIGG